MNQPKRYLPMTTPGPEGPAVPARTAGSRDGTALLNAVTLCLCQGAALERTDVPAARGASLLVALLREVHTVLRSAPDDAQRDGRPASLAGLSGALRDCARTLWAAWPELAAGPSHTAYGLETAWQEVGRFEQDVVRFYKQTYCLAVRLHDAKGLRP